MYDSAGNLVFTASTPQTYSFANTMTGAGNSGFVFALSAPDAATLQALFSVDLRIGLSAQATNATGGFDSIKPAPEMNASVDAGYIMGIGCVKSGDVERMLILTDIEALMSSAEMGLMEAALH